MRFTRGYLPTGDFLARLHEYQGKALLAAAGIPVPRGEAVDNKDDAARVAGEIGEPVVVKMQAWTTKRADLGGIQFANDPDQARLAAADMLGKRVGQFTVDKVLIEERLAIRSEYYASVLVDDAARKPLLLFATGGGTGIEDRAERGELKLSRTHFDPQDGCHRRLHTTC